MELIQKKENENSIALYKLNDKVDKYISEFIFSSDQTRKITCDSLVCGMEYTNLLRDGATLALKALVESNQVQLYEDSTAVVNLLRGGLNFGLREALFQAFNWNSHSSIFLSAQRVYKSEEDKWEISETDYKKLLSFTPSTLVLGDVVATGTSLNYLVSEILNEYKEKEVRVLFFTIGARKTREVFEDVIYKLKLSNIKVNIIYFEGIFDVASDETKMTIKLPGTDLLFTSPFLAPEFLEFQDTNPSYPLERCAIYDAGSRAFDVRHYLDDIKHYWSQVLSLAKQGVAYKDYYKERKGINCNLNAELENVAIKILDKICNI